MFAKITFEDLNGKNIEQKQGLLEMNKKTALTAGFLSHPDLGYAEDPSGSYQKDKQNNKTQSEFRFLVSSIEKLHFTFPLSDSFFNLSETLLVCIFFC